MKRRFTLILGIILALLCSGCAGEPKQSETLPPPATETVPQTEPEATVHEHAFGPWEYGQLQMQRACQSCGEVQLQDMTEEEQFQYLLKGHWEPYEVTFMGEPQPVYYLRNGVWHYCVDYDAGDSLIYTASPGNTVSADFVHALSIDYSHYDAEHKTHHALAVSPEGRSFEIALETGHPEPLLYLTPEIGTDMFERIVFSRYSQVAPIAVGTWSGINGGEISCITLNEDQTFTSGIDALPSGTWQLAPSDLSDIGGLQLFYESEGRMVSALCAFTSAFSNPPDVQAGHPELMLEIITPAQTWNLWKLQPEQLQPLLERGKNRIVGTWDSKLHVSLMRDNAFHDIRTGYTLSVEEDGTFTMTTDKKVTGTWIPNGIELSGDRPLYKYLFTYPGGGRNGDDVTIFSDNSGNLRFSYKQGNTYTHFYFAQYDQAQWDKFLAGPELLPGSYVSRKIIRYDASGQGTEAPETGYTLTILADGTVTGMLHIPVSGTWVYDDLSTEEGHRYIFRMDHTPPEQTSDRKDDGSLVFDTKIDGEHVVIYFDPQ